MRLCDSAKVFHASVPCSYSAQLDQAAFDVFRISPATVIDRHERTHTWINAIVKLLTIAGRMTIIDPIT